MAHVLLLVRDDIFDALSLEISNSKLSASIIRAEDSKDLLSQLQNCEPHYVILDELPYEDSREDMIEHLKLFEEKRVPSTVFLKRFRNEDFRTIFLGLTMVDEILEVRSPDDYLKPIVSLCKKLNNISSSNLSVRDDLVELGSLFQIDFDDNGEDASKDREVYDLATIRSLISHDMAQMGRGLRDFVSRLATFPLRKDLPWDPNDTGEPWSVPPAEKGEPWGFIRPKNGANVPNLQDVFNAFRNPDARKRLDGEIPADPKWNASWSGDKPPLLLITGESGTGKSLLARVIADVLNPNPGSPSRLVSVNTPVVSIDHFEHKIMGAAPDAWSGIDEAMVGASARAAHGVLFFDEIGDMPADVQAAILIFLQDRMIRPFKMHIGFSGFQFIIAATNHDLEELVERGSFRNDLLARFEARLRLPSLRERDPRVRTQLVDFLAQNPTINPRHSGNPAVTHISQSALDEIAKNRQYRNGNFREMGEVVHQSLREARRQLSKVVELDHIPPPEKVRIRSNKLQDPIGVNSWHENEVVLNSESDLWLLAERTRTVVFRDAYGQDFVVHDGTKFTAQVDT